MYLNLMTTFMIMYNYQELIYLLAYPDYAYIYSQSILHYMSLLHGAGPCICRDLCLPRKNYKSQQPPLALFRTSRISSYHQLFSDHQSESNDSRNTFSCRLISNHLSLSPSIIFQIPCPAPSPTMILASIFPPLPGSGRDWEFGSGWNDSSILLGEKRGRLNLAEFKYG